jgi:hypothetical protein
MKAPIDSEYTVVQCDDGGFNLMHLPTMKTIAPLERHDLIHIADVCVKWLEDEAPGPETSAEGEKT